MNKFIIGLCILLGCIALKDLYLALFTESSFDDINGLNVNFEAGYYLFGAFVGILAHASKSSTVRLIGAFTGFICLCIGFYSVVDLRQNTIGKAEYCVKLPTADEVSKCLKELKINPR